MLLMVAAMAAAIVGSSGHAAAQAQEGSGLAAAAAIESALVEAIARAEKSVVAIARIRKDDAAPRAFEELRFPSEAPGLSDDGPTSPDFVPHEFGAGVVIDKAGLILTSLHVLGEVHSSNYVVWVQRRPFPAKVKAADPTLEIAVLQITADDLVPITFGNAKNLKKGHIAIALGNPLGVARDGQASANWGIIANLGRQAPPNPMSRARSGRESLHHYGTLIQLDTKVPLGCSGGALVNLRGEMIGLTTTYTGLPGQTDEAGLAIPIDDDFKKALDTLKTGRLPEYGFLGIAPRSLALSDRQSGKLGTVVEDVVPGTPAARAGLRPGDLITHVGGELVQDDLHLIRLVSAMPAETKVTLQVVRDLRTKKPVSIPVVLSKKYQESARESYALERDPAWRGMRVEYATASPAFRELARHVDPEGCIAVVDVERDSPSWKAGLRGGLFVSHVNEIRVATPKQFHSAVEGAAGEVALRVTTPVDGTPVRKVPAL